MDGNDLLLEFLTKLVVGINTDCLVDRSTTTRMGVTVGSGELLNEIHVYGIPWFLWGWKLSE